MRLSHELTTSQPLRRLHWLGAVVVFHVLAFGCGGRAVTDPPPADASPDASVCDRSPCVLELAAGTSQACARLDDGTVRCWGANKYGQAGVDKAEAVTRPATVRLAARADKLRVGAQTSCAFSSGNLSCWGLNADFGVGPGIWADKGAYPVPVPVARPGLIDIGLGQSVFCTLSAEGEVACAGDNSYGNTGLGAAAPHIPALTPLPNLRATTPERWRARDVRQAAERRGLVLGRQHRFVDWSRSRHWPCHPDAAARA